MYGTPYEKPIKQDWRQQCKEIERFFLSSILINRRYSMKNAAKDLNRSNGSISESLRLALALRIYPKEMEIFTTRYDALEYLRTIGKCQRYPCHNFTNDQIAIILESIDASAANT